jgi:hypothetical protein
MTAPFPKWEWWTWLLSGIVLALAAIGAGWWDRKQAIQDADKKHNEVTSGQDTLASGMVMLARILDAQPNQSSEGIAQLAAQQIHNLKTKVGELERFKQIQWLPLSDSEKHTLISKLRVFGTHKVQINSHPAIDCVALAGDLTDCFEAAEWKVRKWPLTHEVNIPEGDNGIFVTASKESEVLHRVVQDALIGIGRAPVAGLLDYSPSPVNEWPEIRILIKPKRGRYDF